MTRNESLLIRKTKKYINSLGYLYYDVPNAGSVMLLKEGGDNNHYLMIIFTGRNRLWEYDRRHFSMATLYPKKFEDVEKGIAKYLNNA